LSADKGYLEIGTCQTYFNTFSQNSLYENGEEGIRFSEEECDGVTYYPNQNISPPTLTSATTALVSGTACANCTVEVFIADKTEVNDPGGDNFGEGKVYLATGSANAGGSFAIPVAGVAADQLVTATATDGAGNTSPFARNVLVDEAPTPTPTSTTTVTNTPTETATPTVTPSGTASVTPTGTSTGTVTITPSGTVTVTPTGTTTGTVTVTPTPPTPIVAGPYTVNLPMVIR
jgi:hypothetical protein